VPVLERTVVGDFPEASIEVSLVSVKVATALLPTQIGSAVLAGLSAISLVLAMLGLYAVVSSAVERRRFEVGVCVALGASTGNVLWKILKEAVVIMGIGSPADTSPSLGIRCEQPVEIGVRMLERHIVKLSAGCDQDV
jgi:hypothetical protein